MARNLINSTEDLIERAATESSLGGQPNQVKCDGGAPVGEWLRDELARFRTY